MQSATQATLSTLVEQHLTSLIREAATVNRHSKRGGVISASNDAADRPASEQRKRRRLIHHDDINMALLWRGSEKLYVSGVVIPPSSDDDKGTLGKQKQLSQLLKNVNSKSDVGTLANSSTIPRIDLNAYLSSENTIRPPCEMGMTLHWLAVDGVSPMIPYNDARNYSTEGEEKVHFNSAVDISPAIQLGEEDSSIRIRELQHRLLSEELHLYYSRVTAAFSSPSTSAEVISTALHGLRNDRGIQELVPFLCRFVANGLMERKKLKDTEFARRLVRVFDAMLENRSLHLDLHVSGVTAMRLSNVLH